MVKKPEKMPSSLVDFLEEKPKSLSEYRDILKRRRFFFAIPALAVLLGAVLIALTLPPNYRSEATILIEDQDIPEDIIGATISRYATRQIELISRRLLTAKSISAIVERFEVYGPVDADNPVPPTVLANWFRQDMELGLVASDEFDARRRTGDPVIAFNLAFNSSDPEMSQKVTEELVTLFLSENQRSSTERTAGVSELLKGAIAEANDVLLAREAELAAFKEAHEGALPELHELNLNVINRAEQQLSDVVLRIRQLQQRQIQLSAELSQISPSAPVTLPTGETIMSDRERLRALLIDYRRKSAIYEVGHPDLVRMEREIATLRNSVGEEGTYDLLQEQLRQERERLRVLQERYSGDHPDVRYTEASIRELEAQISATSPQEFRSDEVADNPAYVFLHTQIRSSELELQSLIQKRIDLEETIAEHEALIKQAPQVEMEYEGLLRSYQDAKTTYVDLQSKLRAAEIAGDVELGMTGQRFILIEPPVLPLGPDGPDRQVIVVFGFLFALAAGVGSVVIVEFLDNSIRGAQKLADIVGAPPFAVIPYLDNSADIADARAKRVLILAVSLAVGILSVVYVLYAKA